MSASAPPTATVTRGEEHPTAAEDRMALDALVAILDALGRGEFQRAWAVALQTAAGWARQGRAADAAALLQATDRARDRLVPGASRLMERLQRTVPCAITYPAAGLDILVLPPGALAALRGIADAWRSAEQLRALGADPPAVVAITGAPGSGRTTAAAALAGHLGWPLVSAPAAAFAAVGDPARAARRLRLWWDTARATRAVFVLDAADALCADPAPFGPGSAEARGIAVLVVAPNAPLPWWVEATVGLGYGWGATEAVAILRRRLGPLGEGVDWPAVAEAVGTALDAGTLPHPLPAELVRAAAVLIRAVALRSAPVTTEGVLAALGL